MDLEKINMDDLEKELVLLHSSVIKQLRKRIDSGEATGAEYNIAWKILKDNDVALMKLAAAVEAQEVIEEDDDDAVVFKLPSPMKRAAEG